MPPRASQKSKATRERGQSSISAPPPRADRRLQTAAWPRADLEPFPLDHLHAEAQNASNLSHLRTLDKRALGAPWGDVNKVFYNKWLHIRFHPTPCIDSDLLELMDIHDAVTDMLTRMGLGILPTERHPVYRELCIQFFSSIGLHHEDGADVEDARTYFIAFLLRGKEYRLTVPQLCTLYQLDATKRGTDFPDADSPFIGALWRAIGDPKATCTRSMKITSIRNPVLRIVAKIIGIVFFGREETGNVSTDDIALLHYGLQPSAHAIYSPEVTAMIPPTLETNLGYQFARILHRRRLRGLTATPRGKDDYLGGLLGPIFAAVGMDLDSETTVDSSRAAFDVTFFKNARILKKNGFTYQFEVIPGQPLWVGLPVDGITIPDCPAALAFDVPSDLLLDLHDLRGERTRRPSATSRPRPPPPPAHPQPHFPPPPPAHPQPHFPDPSPIMGAPVWEEVSDDFQRGWPVFHRNMERLHKWLTCGGCCRRPMTQETRGEPSRPAARGREDEDTEAHRAADADAEEDYTAAMDDAEAETAIVPYQTAEQDRYQSTYRRRNRRDDQFPPARHSGSSEDQPQ